MTKGKVYLVGAGPGDPKLITVYGMDCIQQADVILYDRLVNEELLKYAKPHAELIFCGKQPGKHHIIQQQIHELLLEKATEGKTVTRLKGGDPCIFGRVGEEAELLAENGISYEIVPGITSGIAAPAYAGIPVTHRDYASSFAIVTGHSRAEKEQDELNWPALAQGIDTIAFYMGVGNLNYICTRLIENGRSPETKAAIIQWGTSDRQRTITGSLKDIEERALEAGIAHPAIVLVGDVVGLRDKLRWFPETEVKHAAGIGRE
ncbi:uroporphyrinogen-III C-methyltransferase [Neobacillus massiliamazoniensis]|uniref:Uroporphyrinogen-III C-methyltransferase n=1 Tax=Neobacillus massiliamazoniensis TaxID=1499688 RepID=A0A0U1NYZ9_9BACI|nr:uroporphyrinogen-III C-methyltransferase [Neobacillus massiliamazoniensis]CRK83260.1 uroporphyrin-III C-methyltransferase [Neobacillus massiliamazoniensis]